MRSRLPSRQVARALVTILLIAAPAQAFGTAYSYDELHRLTQVIYDDGTIVDYRYDSAGNRTSEVISEDSDGDSIRFSGGVNPCAGGSTSGCEDNCPTLANSDQADFEGDAIGDVCDEDDDNDLLLDSYETDTGVYVSATNTGTDPLDADTDGDGFGDGIEVQLGFDPNDPGSRPGGVPTLPPAALVLTLGAMLTAGWWALRRSTPAPPS